MTYIEVRFEREVGAWFVELGKRKATSYSNHEWLVVALWRAWRRLRRVNTGKKP